jgi:membrane protein YfhO
MERATVDLSQHGSGARTSWRAGVPPVVVLGTLLLLAFRGALAGRVFYLRDISQNHYPIRRFVTERLLSGALPLWDPYHGCGTPLLANPNTLALHPISALFLVLPFDLAFTASIVLQFLLLAWGGYLLARRVSGSREGATLAAAVLALAGPAVSLASLQNVLSAAAWVPLGVWAFLRGLETGHGRFLPFSSLLLSVVLMTGEPASLLAFVLLATSLGVTARPPAAGRASAIRPLVALAAVGGVAILIAMAQILPARGLLPLTPRGAGFAPEEALKWSLEPARLLESVLPGLFGDPTHLSPLSWWGGWRFEGSYPFLLSIYVGAIPLLLAVAGVLSRGERAVRRGLLGGVAVLGLWLALGKHSLLYRSLYAAFPAVRQIRYPERFVLVTLFATALLAAVGLESLLHGETRRRRAALAGIFGAAAAAFVVMAVAASSAAGIDRFLAEVTRAPSVFLQSAGGPAVRGAVFRSGLWMFSETALLALAGAMAVRARASLASGDGGWTAWAQRAARASGWATVAASGLSMALASGPPLSTAAPGWLSTPSPLAERVEHGGGAPRLHHDPRPAGFGVWTAKTDELIWGYRFDRFAYALGTGHADHIPTALDAAADQMDLEGPVALGRSLGRLTAGDALRVLSISGVGYLLTDRLLDRPEVEPLHDLEAFSRPPTRVYRIKSVLARVRFVPQAASFSHPDDLAMSLADRSWDPERSVLLEGESSESVPDAPGQGGGEVVVEVDEPERLGVRVRSPSRGYLVVTDAHAPGWRAEIDGARAPILKANGLFRAVALAPGDHEVRMTYRPPGLAAGACLSLLGLVVAGAWAYGTRRCA